MPIISFTHVPGYMRNAGDRDSYAQYCSGELRLVPHNIKGAAFIVGPRAHRQLRCQNRLRCLESNVLLFSSLMYWPRGTGFSQLPSAVISTVDPPLGLSLGSIDPPLHDVSLSVPWESVGSGADIIVYVIIML
jgi:hypothetical protein